MKNRAAPYFAAHDLRGFPGISAVQDLLRTQAIERLDSKPRSRRLAGAGGAVEQKLLLLRLIPVPAHDSRTSPPVILYQPVVILYQQQGVIVSSGGFSPSPPRPPVEGESEGLGPPS